MGNSGKKRKRKNIFINVRDAQRALYIASATSLYFTAILTELASIPWETRITIERWQKSLNVALEKIQGVRLLTKLQTINLLEADYNTGTKLIFIQRMISNAYDMGLILEFQCACRYTQLIEAIMLKRLLFDNGCIRFQGRLLPMIREDASTEWYCPSVHLLSNNCGFNGVRCRL